MQKDKFEETEVVDDVVEVIDTNEEVFEQTVQQNKLNKLYSDQKMKIWQIPWKIERWGINPCWRSEEQVEQDVVKLCAESEDSLNVTASDSTVIEAFKLKEDISITEEI